MKATYKDIQKEYLKINSAIKNSNHNDIGGGFFDKATEKKYQRAISSWNDYFVRNKNSTSNIEYLKKLTFGTKGDITKFKEFNDSLKMHTKYLNEILSGCKSSKDICENSYIKIFMDVSDILTNSKYINAFKVAYDEYEKSKTNINGNICNIFIMCHQIMTSYLYFCMGTINHSVISSYNQTKSLNINKNELNKDFVNFLEESQNIYHCIISDIGFIALECAKNFEAMKNPSDEIKKAIKTQKESNDKIAKAKESHDLSVIQKAYYEISNESYLCDDSSNIKGSEDAIVVAAIVVVSIVGLFALIAGIRRAIYICGTLKTDINNYIKVDVITVSMNIELLKEKLDSETDPKERKRIQSIIDKQQKFVDKFASKCQDAVDESEQVSYEVTYTIDDEDKTDEKDIETSSSDDGGYDILI